MYTYLKVIQVRSNKKGMMNFSKGRYLGHSENRMECLENILYTSRKGIWLLGQSDQGQ